MAESDSDLRNTLKVDWTSLSDFTDLETKRDSRIRRAASSSLPNEELREQGIRIRLKFRGNKE